MADYLQEFGLALGGAAGPHDVKNMMNTAATRVPEEISKKYITLHPHPLSSGPGTEDCLSEPIADACATAPGVWGKEA